MVLASVSKPWKDEPGQPHFTKGHQVFFYLCIIYCYTISNQVKACENLQHRILFYVYHLLTSFKSKANYHVLSVFVHMKRHTACDRSAEMYIIVHLIQILIQAIQEKSTAL